MKNIILFFRSNIKRSMVTLIIAIAFSITICCLFVAFGSSFGDSETKNIKVGFIDEDNSSISIDFKRYLNEELEIVTIENVTYDNLTYQLIDRDISAIIEIPKGLEQNGISKVKIPSVITTTLDDYENVAYIKAYINIYFNSVNLIVEAAEGNESLFQELFAGFQSNDQKIEQRSAYVANKEKDAAYQGLIQAAGFFTMMMMMMSFCTALVVMEDRQSGVFNRIQISPVKSQQYIIGTSMFAVFTSLIIVVVFCTFLVIGGYPIGVPISYLALVMSLFALFMIGFALIVALFCKSLNAMVTFIIILGTIGPILGGAYFSVDGAPELLQRLSKATPHYWMMKGIKDLIRDPNMDVRINILILTLFALLSFLIAAVKFVQKESSRI